MVRNICLTIEYDGTHFHGWQSQRRKGFRTVQEEIEKAARKLFGKNITLIGAARTDAGVHAESYPANFKIRSSLPFSSIVKGLNSYLPKDIAVVSIEAVPQDFHARFKAKEKLYRYTILNRNVRSPLLRRHAAQVYYDLDVKAMRKAAKYLLGKKDFKSFQAGGKIGKSSVRDIKRLDIIDKFPMIEIYIRADGFLYNMARNIVGTLIDAGKGRIRPEEVKTILSKKHRPSAGSTAPAKGLCLVKVFY